jgi:Family of unknown function (DUF5522)
MAEPEALAPGDYYLEKGCVVFTAAYLLKRGTCCGNGCRHCPYEPGSDARDLIAGEQNEL